MKTNMNEELEVMRESLDSLVSRSKGATQQLMDTPIIIPSNKPKKKISNDDLISEESDLRKSLVKFRV